ncbi:SMP-30/gluconolactonase/LRE family protein [Chitinivorax sp. PXF-14]|uniref:SMP-30/gluconolactonase/LRE family protein n=1 Tax=Chitinivorax sp. PXF-14 TaxID=3230488 RepID=UPI003465B01A
MRARHIVIAALLAGAAYLLAWPVNVVPQAWTPPPAPALAGPYAPNHALSGAHRIAVGGHGVPEDIAFGPDGLLYAGAADGSIVRMKPDGSALQVLANTGGRPLGLRFDAAGRLIVADADKGLLAVTPDGKVATLSTEAEGRRFGLPDDLDIGADGTIYFSDASDRFPLSDYESDLIEHGGNGRLLAYDPKTGQTRVLLKGLYFANGVAVSPDQRFVLVVETGEYRLTRYWLTGPKAGTSDVFADNLPGVPDGVLSNGRDTFWVSLPTPRLADLDRLLPYPAIRKIVARLPKAVQPKPKPMGFVLGLDLAGKVTHNLQDPDGRAYSTITNVVEHDGKLWFGSLDQPAVGVVSLMETKQ